MAFFFFLNHTGGAAVDSFRAKGVLVAPVAARGTGCSSGVSGVVMYNAGPKHALVALLPRSCAGGYDALGSGARRGRDRTRSGVGVSAFTSSDLPWGEEAAIDGGGGCGSDGSGGDEEPLRRVGDIAPPHSPIRVTAARQATAQGATPATYRRSFKRDIDRLKEISDDMAEFPTRDGGGVRVEAHTVEGCPEPGSFARAIKDGILAARYMGDSSKSGCRCTAVIEKKTADRFNGLMTELARRHIQGGGGKERELIQGTVNQMGYHCLAHSRSRDYFWESAPWKKLFLSAMRNNDTAMRQQSGRGQSNSSANGSTGGLGGHCDGSGVGAPKAAPAVVAHAPCPSPSPPPPAAAAAAVATTAVGVLGGGSSAGSMTIRDLMLWGEDSWDKAALIPGLGEWEKEEELSDALARDHIEVAYGAVVKVNSSVNRFGPIPQHQADMYMGVVPSPHGPKAVLAVGSYAVCSFSVNLIAAFLCVANEECTFLPEKYLRHFGFKRGEGSARPFRIPKIKGAAVTATARALVQSPVARVLVWPHFAGTNAAIAKAKALLPCEKSGLSEAKSAFVALQAEAAADWRAFRASMIAFVRARHRAMCSAGNRATGLTAGEPHPFFAAKDPSRGSPGRAPAKAAASPAAEAKKGAGAIEAAAQAPQRHSFFSSCPSSSSSSSSSSSTSFSSSHSSLLAPDSPPFSSLARAATERYTTFSRVILRNTKPPFEISLTNLLRKINTALEASGIGYEECEALSHLRQMEADGLGFSVGKNGKVLRAEVNETAHY